MNKKNVKKEKDEWIKIKPNKDKFLRKISVKLVIDKNEVIVKNARLWLCFFPRPRIEILIKCSASREIINALGNQEVIHLYTYKGNEKINGACPKRELINFQTLLLVWQVSGNLSFIRNEKEKLRKVTFNLFNFVDFIGVQSKIARIGNSKKRLDILNLSHQDWQIEIQSLPNKKIIFENLKKKGGFAVTHTGVISKSTKKSFSLNEVKDLIYGLKHILSFARGFYSEPILIKGFDKNGTIILEIFNSPTDVWQNRLSWFDYHNSNQIISLFPVFMSKWQDKMWRATLHDVIYWYLNSNDGSRGVDVGMILSQTAIEKMSFEYVVETKKLITAKGFKDLRASDKFRILFSSLDIPIKINPSQARVSNLAEQLNWLDAPHALTEIRNALVHPDHKHKDKFDDINLHIEAWRYSLWFLELSILRICGYQGTYSNRLKKKRFVGEVEDVPWKS